MYKKIKEFADRYNQELEAHHFNKVVSFVHRDGSCFSSPHARIIKIVDKKNVSEGPSWARSSEWHNDYYIVVFTEHLSYFVLNKCDYTNLIISDNNESMSDIHVFNIDELDT